MNSIYWAKRGFSCSRLFRLSLCLLIAGLLLVMAGQLWGAEKPYYKGKKLILLNNYSPGGSSDTWTRLQARHIDRFIPGNPGIIVQNMPGAEGIVAYRWLGKVAKRNGLIIGCFGGEIASKQATGGFPKGTPDLRTMEIIAGIQDTDVFFGRKAVFPQGYKSFLSPTKRPIVIANLERDDQYVRDAAVMKLLGLKRGKDADFFQVTGYPGGADAYLALGRGEADYYVTRIAGYRRTPLQEVKAGNFVPLWQGGVVTGTGQIVRDPGVKDMPTLAEVVQELTGKSPSGPYWGYIKWLTLGKSCTRFVVAPPGTSKEIVAILSRAWGQMLKDPKYLADQAKIFGHGGDIMFLSEEVRGRLERILDKAAVVDKVYKELIAE